MEKEFLPYEQALALKELGFNKECLGWYHPTGYIVYSITRDKDSIVNSPTLSQAFRFFREDYNIVHTVYSNASGYIWELHYNQERGGTHICDSGESGDCEMSGMFTTYEKAELECIKKLIEICQKKK